MAVEWKQLAKNMLLQGDNFYISYNPRTDTPDFVIMMFRLLIGREMPNHTEETALCIKQEDESKHDDFFVLNGDFRAEYEQAFPCLADCIAVYERHKEECKSDWSTDRVLSD